MVKELLNTFLFFGAEIDKTNFQSLEKKDMSQAFVREGDDQSLADITPTLNSLLRFLTGENNGVRVHEKKQYHEGDRTVHVMSNGLSYTKDNNGRWTILA